jgi:hypothetical protein
MNTTIAIATIALVLVTLYYAWQTRVIASATKAAAEAAMKSTEATERSSQGSLLMTLLREYATPEFLDALELIARGERSKWEIKNKYYRILGDSVGDVKAVNIARHKIWWFYKNAYSLYHRKLLSADDFSVIAQTNGYPLVLGILRKMSESIHPDAQTKVSHFAWVDQMGEQFPVDDGPTEENL